MSVETMSENEIRAAAARRFYEARERRAARRLANPLEADVQRKILTFLEREGVFHWRQNVGGLRDAEGRRVQFGILGLADIIAIQPGTGRFLAIEVKRRGGRLSPKQRRFQERVEAAGGLYVLAMSVEDVRNFTRKGTQG